MNTYDVAMIGAGPAGGQCARELAAEGHRVVLLEKAKTYFENNYSSGGAPLIFWQIMIYQSLLWAPIGILLRIYSPQASLFGHRSPPVWSDH